MSVVTETTVLVRDVQIVRGGGKFTAEAVLDPDTDRVTLLNGTEVIAILDLADLRVLADTLKGLG